MPARVVRIGSYVASQLASTKLDETKSEVDHEGPQAVRDQTLDTRSRISQLRAY